MWLYVLIGSGLGGLARYLVATGVHRMTGSSFPLGTLVVNVTGSFLIGLILRYAVGSPGLSAEARVFLTVGLCGGYTTFSSFSAETLELLRTGAWSSAAVYVVASVLLSLGATAAGFALGGSQRLAAP